MRFAPRAPREGINVSRTHPLREAAILLVGVTVAIIAAIWLTGHAVDVLVTHLSPGLESRLFGRFSSRAAGLFGKTTDHPDLEHLQRLVERLAVHWEEAPYDFEIAILPQKDPNALAVPGGLILITEGLLDEVESENELAFVLGHELGHFHHRHHLKRLGRGLATSLILTAVSGAGDPVGLVGEVANRRFDRDQERAADDFGLGLVYDEYGHVTGAGGFFERLSTEKGIIVDRMESYFGTHPGSADRIQELEELARSEGWLEVGGREPWPPP